jgi:serine protease
MPLRRLIVGLSLATSLPFGPTPVVAAETPPPAAAQDLAAAELIVRLDGPRLHAATDRWIPVDVAPGEDVAEALQRLALTPGVAEVAYNHRYVLHAAPNDPDYGLQWNLDHVRWLPAWEQGYRGQGVVVAVLDSGVGLSGQDLTCRSFVGPYNAATGTPGIDAVADTDGHGTHVTGTLAQCTDNNVLVAGVAPAVSVMPVKVADDLGNINSASVANGIAWAVNNGAGVVNLSLGQVCDTPPCSDSAIDAAIAAAVSAGVVVVASSGNDELNQVGYPASHPATIAVGASTISQTRAEYSNYGSELDLIAPGGTNGNPIWQETFNCNGGGYVLCGFNGTSMAAPHVSGAAAILRSLAPAATPGQIRTALAESALDLGSAGKDAQTGFGLLQIDAAIEAISSVGGLVDPCPTGAACDRVTLVDAGGQWHRWHSLTSGATVSSFYYGNPGDIAFSGDWDCDGEITPGLYRQSDGFVYLRNSNSEGIADITFFFGNPGDVPVAGDFNGDGCDTVSIYRPSEGRFFVINQLGKDGGGLGTADSDFSFGDVGDKPFVGDFDGDGIDTVGLHRETTGLVYLRNTLTTGSADSQFIYGDPGDVILAGDWDGDGDDTVAAYRPGNGRLYVKLANSAGNADIELVAGSFVQAVRSRA